MLCFLQHGRSCIGTGHCVPATVSDDDVLQLLFAEDVYFPQSPEAENKTCSAVSYLCCRGPSHHGEREGTHWEA